MRTTAVIVAARIWIGELSQGMMDVDVEWSMSGVSQNGVISSCEAIVR